MTEQLGILTALVEDSKDPRSVPSTRIRQLTTICNLSCRESNALFQPPWHLHGHSHVYMLKHKYTEI